MLPLPVSITVTVRGAANQEGGTICLLVPNKKKPRMHLFCKYLDDTYYNPVNALSDLTWFSVLFFLIALSYETITVSVLTEEGGR